MKIKTAIYALTLMMTFSSFAGSPQGPQQEKEKNEDMEKMMSLLRNSEPYVAGMGRSAVEVCMDMANDMVKKYGDQLSQLGDPPSKVRDSSYGICLDGIRSAESANSENEIEMWNKSALKNVDDQLKNDPRGPYPREFLTESIRNSVRIAKPIYFMKELNAKYNMH